MATINQGHPYDYMGKKVIALSSAQGRRVKVLIVTDNPWHYETITARANLLKPLPLRYLHGQFPQDRKSVQS